MFCFTLQSKEISIFDYSLQKNLCGKFGKELGILDVILSLYIIGLSELLRETK